MWSQIQLDPLKFVSGRYLDSSHVSCADGFANTVVEVELSEQGQLEGLTPQDLRGPHPNVRLILCCLRAVEAKSLPQS